MIRYFCVCGKSYPANNVDVFLIYNDLHKNVCVRCGSRISHLCGIVLDVVKQSTSVWYKPWTWGSWRWVTKQETN